MTRKKHAPSSTESSEFLRDDESLARLKREIRDELQAVMDRDGTKARLKHILARIEAVTGSTDPKSLSQCFVYCLSALFHHAEHGGLTESQIRKLSHLANAVLRVQNIKPGRTTQAYLFHELHLARSYVLMRSGQLWKAAWEQQLAVHLSPQNPTGGVGFQLLTRAIRAIRLGHLELGLKDLAVAEAESLSPEYRARAFLERLKALRLQGALKTAAELSAKSAEYSLSPKQAQEVEWEAMCRSVVASRDLAPIISATLPRHSHHEPSYILEAFVWTRIPASREWMTRFPLIRSLGKNTFVDIKAHGAFGECASALQQVYDAEIPLPFRLEILGDALGKISQVPTLDWELLLWAAAARWVIRARVDNMRDLVLSEYRALSAKMTSGKSTDVLRLMDDTDAQ